MFCFTDDSCWNRCVSAAISYMIVHANKPLSHFLKRLLFTAGDCSKTLQAGNTCDDFDCARLSTVTSRLRLYEARTCKSLDDLRAVAHDSGRHSRSIARPRDSVALPSLRLPRRTSWPEVHLRAARDVTGVGRGAPGRCWRHEVDEADGASGRPRRVQAVRKLREDVQVDDVTRRVSAQNHSFEMSVHVHSVDSFVFKRFYYPKLAFCLWLFPCSC